jgi:SprT protein
MHQHGRKASPHGAEWQGIYSKLLQEFTQKNVFPDEILLHLQQTIINPKASSCADPSLEKVLAKYNANAADQQIVYVEDLAPGELFVTPENKTFICIQKRRTRYLCQEVSTKKMFLFPAIYQIQKVEH